MPTSEGVDLAREAGCFARYLVGRPSSRRLEARYAEALERLDLLAPRSRYDRRLLAAARRHPLATEALDTAAALLDRQCLLRKRLFVLAGLLETETEFADYFFQPPTGRPQVAIRLAGSGLRAGVWLALGAPVLWILRSIS